MIMTDFLFIFICFGCFQYVSLAPAILVDLQGNDVEHGSLPPSSTVRNIIKKESIPEFHSVGSHGNNGGRLQNVNISIEQPEVKFALEKRGTFGTENVRYFNESEEISNTQDIHINENSKEPAQGEEIISLHGNETIHINEENINHKSHAEAGPIDEGHELFEHRETNDNLTESQGEIGMVASERNEDKIEMPDYWHHHEITESVRDLPEGEGNHGRHVFQNERQSLQSLNGETTEGQGQLNNNARRLFTSSIRQFPHEKQTTESAEQLPEKGEASGSVRQLPDSNEKDPILKPEGKEKVDKSISTRPEVQQPHIVTTEVNLTEERNPYQEHRTNLKTTLHPEVTEGQERLPHDGSSGHLPTPRLEVTEGEVRPPHDGGEGHIPTPKPEVTEGEVRPPHDGGEGHIPTPKPEVTEGEVRPTHDGGEGHISTLKPEVTEGEVRPPHEGGEGHIPTPKAEVTEGEVRPPHDGGAWHMPTSKPEVTEGEVRPPHDGGEGHIPTPKAEVTEEEVRPPHDGGEGHIPTPKAEVTEGEINPPHDGHEGHFLTQKSRVTEVKFTPPHDGHGVHVPTRKAEVTEGGMIPSHKTHEEHVPTHKSEVTEVDIRSTHDGDAGHFLTTENPEEKESHQFLTKEATAAVINLITEMVTPDVTLSEFERTSVDVTSTLKPESDKNTTKVQDKKEDGKKQLTTESTLSTELKENYFSTMQQKMTSNVGMEVSSGTAENHLLSVTPALTVSQYNTDGVMISQDRIIDVSSINPTHQGYILPSSTEYSRLSTVKQSDVKGYIESSVSPSESAFTTIDQRYTLPSTQDLLSVKHYSVEGFTESLQIKSTSLGQFSSQADYQSSVTPSNNDEYFQPSISPNHSHTDEGYIVETISPSKTILDMYTSIDRKPEIVMSTSSIEILPTVLPTTHNTENVVKKPLVTGKPTIKTVNGTRTSVEATVTPKTTTLTTADLYINIDMKMTLYDFCITKQDFISQVAQIMGNAEVTQEQIMLQYPVQEDCDKSPEPWDRQEKEEIMIQMYVLDTTGKLDMTLTRDMAKHIRPGLQSSKSKFGQKLESVQIVTPPKVFRTQPPDILSEEKSETQEIETGITIAISIAAVGGFCCVCLLILQIIIHKRSGKRMHPHFFESASNRFSMRSMDSVALGQPKSRPHSGFWNHGLELEEKEILEPSHPLVYSTLTDFAADTDAIHQEFQLIPNETPRLSCVPIGAEDKNRFANVLPFPHTRVKLKKIPGEDFSDYINANYLTGYKDDTRAYIATQAPMSHTAADFWRMVWEQQSRVVLMLTEMDEGGQPRCLPYWPEKTGIENRLCYGDYYIVLKKKEVHQEYIVSVLEIKDIERNLVREIRHFWYTCWPINGTPEPISLVKFVLDTRPYYEDSGAPVIVHCSPGTGRTGTLIAIDICMRSFEDIRSVNILNTVYKMRKERAGAVSTRDQYNLIYKAVNEYAMVMNTPTSVSTTSSVATLQNML